MTRPGAFVSILACAWLAGCPSAAENVCEDIGLCRTLGSAEIQACQREVDAVGAQAADAGCGPEFDSYFDCASQSYGCDGNVPSFPGCDGGLAGLDACLGAAEAQTSCGQLARALATCPAPQDAGVAPVPQPCTAAALCAARCYLADVPDVCAPSAYDLGQFTACVQACP
ncbi:MAG TPA: hypothetical protein VMB50_20290 [Myxococcales bacterium]|nr:hypothetical protein [Myxococcales bacterium]